MVLLVVDTQRLITNAELYNFDVFKHTVKSLIATARENGAECITMEETIERMKGSWGYYDGTFE